MNYRRLGFAAALAAVVSLWFASVQVVAAEKNGEKVKETKVTMKELPKAVQQTLSRFVGRGGKVIEIEKCVASKVVTYSADVTKADGKAYDLDIDAKGKLIKQELMKPDEDADEEGKDEGSEEGKDEEGQEVKVSLDELPAPVRATLEQEVGSGKIESLEKDMAGGKTVYSADVIKADGNLYDIEIAEDGKLIKSEVEKTGKTD